MMEDVTALSHNELIEITNSSLNTLLHCDPLLSDLPTAVINEEVLSLIAVEYGQAITVFIARDTEQLLKVIVPHDVKVWGLKKAIARHFELYQQRTKNTTKISWKYIWKTYVLSYDGIILDNNESSISEYGVCNKTTLKFVRKNKKKR